jgi:hypothetical protein
MFSKTLFSCISLRTAQWNPSIHDCSTKAAKWKPRLIKELAKCKPRLIKELAKCKPRLIKELQLKKDEKLNKKIWQFNNIENNISDHINNIFSLYLYWYVALRCVA